MSGTDDFGEKEAKVGNLPSMSGEELVRLIVETEQAYDAAADDSEEKNRLEAQRDELGAELKSRFAWVDKLRATGYDPFAEPPRTVTRRQVEPIKHAASQGDPERPLRWQMSWQADNPPPPPLTRDEVLARLRLAVPEYSDRLVDLALPAIGLWPQRVRADMRETASHWGGTPLAPPGWQWPTIENQPLLFIGQINCADVGELPGADQLPAAGILAFFAEHDAVEAGRFEDRAIVIKHWSDVDNLVLPVVPVDPAYVLPACALVMRPLIDLPDPSSRAVRELEFNRAQTSRYEAEWKAMRRHGFPEDADWYSSFSKLLGWPALVQPMHDLDRFEDANDARLLLQVDRYCNGEKSHGWGPGGSLYFVLPERDLREHCYDGCEFDMQFT
jgi:uncharacterized protein YwqG